jgi:hypothetical protein
MRGDGAHNLEGRVFCSKLFERKEKYIIACSRTKKENRRKKNMEKEHKDLPFEDDHVKTPKFFFKFP